MALFIEKFNLQEIIARMFTGLMTLWLLDDL